LFPTGWDERARETEAVDHLRGFNSAEALLRTLLLLHIANGRYSGGIDDKTFSSRAVAARLFVFGNVRYYTG
jgi:hypothetical protein